MMMRTWLIWSLVLLCVSAPFAPGVSAGVVVQKRQTWSYDGGRLTFTNAFSGARLNGVQPGDRPGSYTLTIDREGPGVSNASSWYAFAIDSASARTVEITLSYAWGRHRYPPKIRRGEEGEWIPLSSAHVAKSAGKKEVVLTVKLEPGRTYIAGEPMITVAEQDAWAAGLAAKPFVTRREFGRSAAGMPLRVLETKTARAPDARTVLVMTWQHPPEVSGVRAFRSFVESVLGDTPQAQAFRSAFNLVIVPVANPDGVAEGHWRHNLGDVDLNRDWRAFSQPESRALRDLFKKTPRPGLFLDFHSTTKTVFYTHPDDFGGPPAGFTAAWFNSLSARFAKDGFTRDTGHNPTAATSRNWAVSELGITAITVELADEVDLDWTADFGRSAAEDMMRLLLADEMRR
jgi:cytosolic carboxypeptidase protein 6